MGTMIAFAPAGLGLYLISSGHPWGWLLILAGVAVAVGKSRARTAAETPEMLAHRAAFTLAPKRVWLAPAAGRYCLHAPEGWVEAPLRRGEKIFIPESDPDPWRVD